MDKLILENDSSDDEDRQYSSNLDNEVYVAPSAKKARIDVAVKGGVLDQENVDAKTLKLNSQSNQSDSNTEKQVGSNLSEEELPEAYCVIQSLKEDIEGLCQANNQLVERIAQIKLTRDAFAREISNLKAKNSNLTNENSELIQSSKACMEKDYNFEQLKEELKNAYTEIDNLREEKQSLPTIKAENDKLWYNIKELKSLRVADKTKTAGLEALNLRLAKDIASLTRCINAQTKKEQYLEVVNTGKLLSRDRLLQQLMTHRNAKNKEFVRRIKWARDYIRKLSLENNALKRRLNVDESWECDLWKAIKDENGAPPRMFQELCQLLKDNEVQLATRHREWTVAKTKLEHDLKRSNSASYILKSQTDIKWNTLLSEQKHSYNKLSLENDERKTKIMEVKQKVTDLLQFTDRIQDFPMLTNGIKCIAKSLNITIAVSLPTVTKVIRVVAPKVSVQKTVPAFQVQRDGATSQEKDPTKKQQPVSTAPCMMSKMPCIVLDGDGTPLTEKRSTLESKASISSYQTVSTISSPLVVLNRRGLSQFPSMQSVIMQPCSLRSSATPVSTTPNGIRPSQVPLMQPGSLVPSVAPTSTTPNERGPSLVPSIQFGSSAVTPIPTTSNRCGPSHIPLMQFGSSSVTPVSTTNVAWHVPSHVPLITTGTSVASVSTIPNGRGLPQVPLTQSGLSSVTPVSTTPVAWHVPWQVPLMTTDTSVTPASTSVTAASTTPNGCGRPQVTLKQSGLFALMPVSTKNLLIMNSNQLQDSSMEEAEIPTLFPNASSTKVPSRNSKIPSLVNIATLLPNKSNSNTT